MTRCARISLVLRWIRLLLFSWRSRTNWFVQNVSISWIENVLLSPIMRNTKQSSRKTKDNTQDKRSTQTLRLSEDEENEDSEDFRSPQHDNEETSYNLEYTDMPTTSRAAAAAATTHAAASKTKYYAKKSTSRGPNLNPTEQPSNANVNTSQRSEERPRSRKQAKPKRNYNTLFLREVRYLQATTHLLTAKAPFARLVREILSKMSSEVTHVTKETLDTLHEAAEIYLVQVLGDAYKLTLHRQRVTLSVQDIRLLSVLKLIDYEPN